MAIQSRASRLAPVVDMAEREERDAARALGKCQALLSQAEGKLGDLHRYLGDYQQQFVTEGRTGVSGQWMMNYQRFMVQLDTAIKQQNQSVDWHRSNIDKAREIWQQKYARLEGLRKLVQKYMDEARVAADKREQKLLDELSQRLLQRERN